MPTPESHTVRRVLDNGLTIIARSQRQVPIGSFWVWYRVGGRNEVAGITGVSHWAEHMLFKGTQKFGKGEIFRAVTAAGGTLNGFTWLDYTAYFETLPIDRIDLAFEIESDRMVNARFDPDEVAGERSVIISERQGNENQPTFLLAEEMSAAAFKAHAYGHGVIGHMSDLETMTRDDLYNHYSTYYRPNNAVVVFVGDLDAEEAVDRISEKFGALERGPELHPVRTTEPEQFGERRVSVRRPAPNRVLQIGHKAIPGSHADAPALMVADAILSGGKAMGFGGGASMGRSSRLYRKLVSSELASSAGSSFSLTIDPYLFGLGATLRPDSDPAQVEQVLLDEVARLAAEPVAEEEFERAMKQMRAQHAYGQQSVSSKAYLLGSLAMVAPERTPESLVADIAAVTPVDVQRVVATYLVENRRTVGWLIPDSPGGQSTVPAVSALVEPSGYVPDEDDRMLDESMPRIIESRLPNGLRVVTLDRVTGDDLGPVVVRVRVPGGSSADGDTRGVARFAAEMMTRGSGGRSLDDLAEELDGLGASISAGAGRETLDVVSTSMREDADRVVQLLAAALLEPDFPEEQMQIVRGQILSGLRQAENDSRAEAEHVMRGMLYPEGHPYRDRVSGTQETVSTITHSDLRAFHERAIRPSQAIVAVSGSASHVEAVELVERHFGTWTGETPPLIVADPPALNEAARTVRAMPGKSQADIAIGALALSRQSPDYDALNVANLILGRLGLMGRLGESVRERQGMAYYAYSGLEVGIGAGQWSARAGVSVANIERAIESILTELRTFLADGPTESEFSDAMGYLTGSLPLGMETAGAISGLIADIAFFDLGTDYLKKYRKRVLALTPQQLTETMRRYVDPDRLAVAVIQPAVD